jgi:hypothetical protein
MQFCDHIFHSVLFWCIMLVTFRVLLIKIFLSSRISISWQWLRSGQTGHQNNSVGCHTGVFKFSGCLKTDPKLEKNSFRAPETMNCTFWQKFRVDCKLVLPSVCSSLRWWSDIWWTGTDSKFAGCVKLGDDDDLSDHFLSLLEWGYSF